MKIGVYVGSFNPVHIGHIKIVNHLIKNKYLDKIIIIPTGNYWNKKNLINITDRINMLKLYENKNIIIDEDNNDIVYTYQILKKLSNTYKEDELNLIIGADNIINFDKWKNYKEILEYNLIIINREFIDIKHYLNKLSKFNNYKIINDLPLINISSSLIRDKIKNNNYNDLENYIDLKVINYIKENNLYNN